MDHVGRDKVVVGVLFQLVGLLAMVTLTSGSHKVVGYTCRIYLVLVILNEIDKDVYQTVILIDLEIWNEIFSLICVENVIALVILTGNLI